MARDCRIPRGRCVFVRPTGCQCRQMAARLVAWACMDVEVLEVSLLVDCRARRVISAQVARGGVGGAMSIQSTACA